MNSYFKCFECTHRDRFCVSMFFDAFIRIHEKLQADFHFVEKEFSKILTKVNRFRKQLKLNKTRTSQKVQYVASELGSDNDETKSEILNESLSFFQLMNNLPDEF